MTSAVSTNHSSTEMLRRAGNGSTPKMSTTIAPGMKSSPIDQRVSTQSRA